MLNNSSQAKCLINYIVTVLSQYLFGFVPDISTMVLYYFNTCLVLFLVNFIMPQLLVP